MGWIWCVFCSRDFKMFKEMVYSCAAARSFLIRLGEHRNYFPVSSCDLIPWKLPMFPSVMSCSSLWCSDRWRGTGWEEGTAAPPVPCGAGAAADPERDEEESAAADGQQLDPPALRRHGRRRQQGERPAAHAQVRSTQQVIPPLLCDDGIWLFKPTKIQLKVQCVEFSNI